MTHPTRIPADINRPDRILGPLTARQAVVLTVGGVVLYLAWTVLRAVVPVLLLIGMAVPIVALVVAVALGQRDGLPLDRFLVAALRHRLNPRRVPPALLASTPSKKASETSGLGGGNPPSVGQTHPQDRIRGTERMAAALLTRADPRALAGDPRLPGVIDLGRDGLVAVAVVSTINLGLRTLAEQDALLIGFGRYLNTLHGPTQVLVRTVPLDLTDHLDALRAQAAALPHPALAAAAAAHLAHLADLAAPGRRLAVDEVTGTAEDGTRIGPGYDGGALEDQAGDQDAHREDVSDDDQDLFDDEPQLLSRQVLLVLREPIRAGGDGRLLRRLDDASRFLAPLDVAVTPLSSAQITSLLDDSCHPGLLGCRAAVESDEPTGRGWRSSQQESRQHPSKHPVHAAAPANPDVPDGDPADGEFHDGSHVGQHRAGGSAVSAIAADPEPPAGEVLEAHGVAGSRPEQRRAPDPGAPFDAASAEVGTEDLGTGREARTGTTEEVGAAHGVGDRATLDLGVRRRIR